MTDHTLITGGARSGKSRLAESLAAACGTRLCYLATARPLDEGAAEQFERHRLRRGPTWETEEEPLLVPQTLARIDGLYQAVLLDGVTTWLSNLLLSCDEQDPATEELVLGHFHRLAATLRGMTTPVLLETCEVGMGTVPDTHSARLYRNLAGQGNQLLAHCCSRVFLTVSGIPLQLK